MSAIDFRAMMKHEREQRRKQLLESKAKAQAGGAPDAPAGGAGSGSACAPFVVDASLKITECAVGKLPRVCYVNEWLTGDEEALLQAQTSAESTGWTQLTKRRLINLGGVPHPGGLFEEQLPAWFEDGLRHKFMALGFFGEHAPPNQLLINEYAGTQAGIDFHNDGPSRPSPFRAPGSLCGACSLPTDQSRLTLSPRREH